MQRLEELLAQAESSSRAESGQLEEVVAVLLELHRAAIERMVERIRASDEQVLDACAGDDVISPVLILHGLHPQDLESRVRAALDKVRPYLASHGGHVELLSVSDDGAVRLRLDGSCHGCPSSRVTLQSSIEQEIYAAAPDVTAIEVDGLVEEPAAATANGFVPIADLAINGAALPAAAPA
jgi:Fe-S cluster biogenesis protein NfuA